MKYQLPLSSYFLLNVLALFLMFKSLESSRHLAHTDIFLCYKISNSSYPIHSVCISLTKIAILKEVKHWI